MKQTVEIRTAAPKDFNLLSALSATINYEPYFETGEPEDLALYIADYFNPQAIKAELEDENATFLPG